jgi:GNAT superfamily N-acetyltransferase
VPLTPMCLISKSSTSTYGTNLTKSIVAWMWDNDSKADAPSQSRRMTPNFVIRELTCSDAQRVAELNAQLGYDADVHQIRSRLDRLGRDAAHHAIGVEAPQGLVAFAHFFERPAIEKGFDMVVQSLVVDSAMRRSGIGRLLMERIEHVARSMCCDTVALSSQISRNDAREFYKRLGYEISATSNVFLKRLA